MNETGKKKKGRKAVSKSKRGPQYRVNLEGRARLGKKIVPGEIVFERMTGCTSFAVRKKEEKRA